VAAERIWISDFCLDELLARTGDLWPLSNQREYQHELRASSQLVLAPKLIVMLQASPELCAVAPGLAEMQERLSRMLSEPGRQPVLRLAAADVAWNLDEIVAAALAMR
jgi:hypothetical protein